MPQSATKKILARDLMNTQMFSVNEHSSISFTELASETWRVRHIPVVAEKDKLVGIVSHRDLLFYFAHHGNAENLEIRTIMKPEVVTAPPDATVDELAKIMLDFEISAVPIVENGCVLGLVSERDFLRLHCRDLKLQAAG